jgi:hypothetical protein
MLTENRQREDSFIQGGSAAGRCGTRNDSTKRGSSGDFGWHCHLEEQKADAAISVNADGARVPRSASLRSQ